MIVYDALILQNRFAPIAFDLAEYSLNASYGCIQALGNNGRRGTLQFEQHDISMSIVWKAIEERIEGVGNIKANMWTQISAGCPINSPEFHAVITILLDLPHDGMFASPFLGSQILFRIVSFS